MVQTRMMIDPNAKTRRGGGKHLGIRRGEILEVIEFTSKEEMLCRDTKGKCESPMEGSLGRQTTPRREETSPTHPCSLHRWLRAKNSSTAPVSASADWGQGVGGVRQWGKVTLADPTVLSTRETEVYDDVAAWGM